MDWDAEGLLEGLPDERARSARRRLLDELHGEGVPLEELREAVAEERLALLPLERLLGEQRYTLDEIVEATGVERGWLLDSRRALGLAGGWPDARIYG